MYRLAEIVESFKGLVGWDEGRNNPFGISSELAESDSGLYYQEANPLLTLRAMQGVMPKDIASQYPSYDATATYSKGDVVVSLSNGYRSLVNNNINHSLSDTSYWEPYALINDYLDSIETAGIKKVITRFIRDKVIGMETKNIIDRRTLFDGAGRLDARTENRGRIVGFEINPIRGGGVTMKLEKIGLQFIGNTGNVTLYLFHSSKSAPVKTITLNYTAVNGTFQWFDLSEWLLPYQSSELNAGGSWYLVYNQATLPNYMESINFGRDWSREPCSTCNKGDVQLYRMLNQWVQISPFYVEKSNWNGNLWDIRDNVYTYCENYGINLQFSLGCDLTDTLIATRGEFANVVQLQVASLALKTLALNPDVEVNRVQYNADRNNILFETDGNGQGIKGLNSDLEKAYKALSFDTKGLDSVCLSCHNKGIKIGAI